MSEPFFIDRDQELTWLSRLLTDTAEGRGRAAAISGSAGIGKSSILRELERRAGEPGAAGGCRLVRVPCYSGIGEVNAYGPFLELFRGLQRPQPRRRGLLRRSARGVSLAAPDVLSLVPAVGPLLQAGALVTKAAFDGGAEAQAGSGGVPLAAAVRQSVCEAVLALALEHGPLVVAVDDAHLIDESSSLVLRSLAEELAERPLGFILAYRPEEVGDGHPLHEVLHALDWDDGMLHLRLEGFPRPVVSDYLNRLTRRTNATTATDRLLNLTGGHPILLAQYLRLLEERSALHLLTSTGAGPGVELPGLPAGQEDEDAVLLPAKVARVLQERIKRIDPETVRLLVIGATQGEHFMSAVVERVSGAARGDVLHRLHQVSRDFGVIRAVRPPAWVVDTGSDYYLFDHALLRLAFYSRQSAQARRDRHAAIADILDRMGEAVPGTPQEFILDVCHHYHMGGKPMLAARHALHTARDLAMRTSSFSESAALCHRALDELNTISPPTPEADRLRVEAIELLLVVTALRWRGRIDLQQSRGMALADLAAEASVAAARTGDHALRARALFLEGKTLLRTDGVNAALPKLRAAMDLAGSDGDTVTRFIATAEYGHQLTKQDLTAGLQLLRQAEAMHERHQELRTSEDPTVRLIVDEVRMQLGVNSFDAGDFGEADRRLPACVDSLRDRNRHAELTAALNYLAQMRIALGDLAGAAAALREAIAVEESRTEERTGWYGCNLSLLGRTTAQLGDLAEARRLVGLGWEVTERFMLVDIVPIVRIHHAEVSLLCADRAALDSAETMLRSALREAHDGGLPRSEVNALALLARLRLHTGDPSDALSLSTRAVDLLDHHGQLSTVRSEEVFLHHARAVEASGDRDGAREWVVRAWDEVRRKAESIPDADPRRRFVDEERVNRLVSRAYRDGLGSTPFTEI